MLVKVRVTAVTVPRMTVPRLWLRVRIFREQDFALQGLESEELDRVVGELADRVIELHDDFQRVRLLRIVLHKVYGGRDERIVDVRVHHRPVEDAANALVQRDYVRPSGLERCRRRVRLPSVPNLHIPLRVLPLQLERVRRREDEIEEEHAVVAVGARRGARRSARRDRASARKNRRDDGVVSVAVAVTCPVSARRLGGASW